MMAQLSSAGVGLLPRSSASFKIKKGPGANEPQAKSMGSACAELAARESEGRQNMVRRAITVQGTNLAPKTNLVPIGDERDEAQAFSAVIIPFSAGELAKAAKRTKEAAKGWKEGRSLPSAWSMLNMAREIPAVRSYMLAKLGAAGPHMQFNSPQAMDALAQAVHAIATMPGPDGDRLRAVMAGGKKGRS
jgi:hypothetical protein